MIKTLIIISIFFSYFGCGLITYPIMRRRDKNNMINTDDMVEIVIFWPLWICGLIISLLAYIAKRICIELDKSVVNKNKDNICHCQNCEHFEHCDCGSSHKIIPKYKEKN